MKVDLIDYMGSDLTVVNAARVSFNKKKEELDEADEKLIRYLSKNNHWTPFSHPQITVRVKAPIFVARQLFKHKVGMSENEISRRYVDDDPEFYVPDKWRGRPTNGAKQGSSSEEVKVLRVKMGGEILVKDAVQNFNEYAEDLYKELIEVGVAPEQARMILPQSMYTEWYLTGSLASFARLAKLRLDEHSQSETREIAKMMESLIEPLFPVSWRALLAD